MSIQIVILAAGSGKRMHSHLPKVLHGIGGKPLLEHVIQTALLLTPDISPIIVYGHQGEKLQAAFAHYPVRWVLQKEQLGTGHALLQALPEIGDATSVLVLCGDVPLISINTLEALCKMTPKNAIGMVTTHLVNPTGYGRIIRDENNHVQKIIEEKDATLTERAITEINTGIYLFPSQYLQQWLSLLNNDNAQQEYYLTDMVVEAVKNKVVIQTVQPTFNEEILGVNDRLQQAQLERFYQKQIADHLMKNGVTLLDPARFDVRGEVQIGRDVVIDINVILEGRVIIGNGCRIGPHSILRNVALGEDVEIKAHSILDGAEIASGCLIGPFARIRPETILAPDVHIGNFVEVKNSQVGNGSKINHLSYVGDSEVGKHVNIGAGTITCNYDGVHKHKTIIKDYVQIGSDTQLVAPVTIGEGAVIGAGSTVTKNAAPHELTLTQQLDQRSRKLTKKQS